MLTLETTDEGLSVYICDGCGSKFSARDIKQTFTGDWCHHCAKARKNDQGKASATETGFRADAVHAGV